MRILHSADWHLGHELAGWTRQSEQALVLREIADLCKRHDVDALVVAGDIFDHQNPSSEMYRQFYTFFDDLARQMPDLVAVVIAGNHDSANRLDAPAALLRRANTHVFGALRRKQGEVDLAHHLVPVARQGKIRGHVLAIPYLRPGDLPELQRVGKEGEASPLAKAVKTLYQSAISSARKVSGETPLVVTGHLHARGASLSESLSERRLLIGGEHAVPASAFSRSADYVALGHLHRAQTLGEKKTTRKSQKKGRVRYAGSPWPLSAVEMDYAHGVSLVEIAEKICTIKHLELTRQVPFLRLPAQGRMVFDEVEAALEALDLDPGLSLELRPFVQLRLRLEGPRPGLFGALDEICARFPLRALAADIERAGKKKATPKPAPTKRLIELAPREIFENAFESTHGFAPEKEHINCFNTLFEREEE